MNKVHRAFATPLYKDHIVLDKSKINPALKAMEFKRINTGDRYHSSDYKILDNDLLFLKKDIQLKIEDYAYNHLGLAKRHKLKITDSWVMKHYRDDSSEIHWHPNSIISGVIYLQTDKDSGNICFFREKNLFNDILDFEFVENAVNQKEIQVTPNDGMILLFPSKTLHGVNKSNSDVPRFCCAFNTWIEGDLDPPFRSQSY